MRRHKSTAQPVQIARQAAEAAQSAAQSVDLTEVRETVTSQAARAAEAARDAAANVDLSDVRDTIAAQAARAAEAARDAAANVDLADVKETVTTEVAKDYALAIDETRRRPLRSLLIALGVGAVIGAAVDRMSRKRKPEPPRSQWGPTPTDA